MIRVTRMGLSPSPISSYTVIFGLWLTVVTELWKAAPWTGPPLYYEWTTCFDAEPRGQSGQMGMGDSWISLRGAGQLTATAF